MRATLFALLLLAGLQQQQPQVLDVTPTDPRAMPTIRPLPKKPLVNVTFTGNVQLDGLNCEQCTFRNVTLSYSGGAFRCTECGFDGSLMLQLKGAAANGASIANWVDAVRSHRIEPAAAVAPTTITVTITEPFKTDLYSASVAAGRFGR